MIEIAKFQTQKVARRKALVASGKAFDRDKLVFILTQYIS